MSIDKKLLDILACPSCKQRLSLDASKQIFICRFDQLSFPIRDGIPVLLLDEATPWSETSADTKEHTS